jgi:predicted nucleic acid-binding protein
MSASFIDTNVLVYLASDDNVKADQAEMLVAQGGIISVQVLNELANVARRKMRMSWRETRALLEPITEFLEVRALTGDTHLSGLSLAERYELSVYDAMIVAAAIEADCETLWSEDLQHGLRIGSLRVLNPFRGQEERR